MRQKVKTSYSFRRYATEGFLCHLQHLRQALDEAGLSVQDILSSVEPDLLKRQKYKARQKILKDSPSDHEQSFWMRHTPCVERQARALRGYWPRFPVSPDQYAEQMERLFKPSGFYSENQSFGLERKLSAFIERKEARSSEAERCALYRAFLTVMIEQMDKMDDSYGVIGDLYGGVFDQYIQTINTCKRSLRFAPKGTRQRATALHYLGIAHLMLQHLDEAYQALSEALTITPDDADLLYNRGRAARYTSRQGQSVRDLERALSLERDPSRASKIAEELQFARRLAEHDMVLRGPDFTLDQFIEQEELYHSGVELLTAEQWEQAEQTFRAVIAMGDCMPQPWNNLGMCLMMQRRYDEAEAALQRALEINPNYENARRNLALLPEIRRTGILPGHTITGPFDGHDLRKSIDFRVTRTRTQDD